MASPLLHLHTCGTACCSSCHRSLCNGLEGHAIVFCSVLLSPLASLLLLFPWQQPSPVPQQISPLLRYNPQRQLSVRVKSLLLRHCIEQIAGVLSLPLP